MSRNALRSALMVFALCLTLSAAVSARAETLKLLSSWPENMIFVTGAVTPFKENLKKFSDAGLDIEYFGPDVIPAMEQLQPLEARCIRPFIRHSGLSYGGHGRGRGRGRHPTRTGTSSPDRHLRLYRQTV